MKDHIAKLQVAIRHLHGCESKHVLTVPVTETFDGKTVWQGEVEVFNLLGHPKAKHVYAWAYQGDDSQQHYTAVLALPPIDSALAAVRAASVAKVKNETKET